MTVQELIDELEKIEDRSLPVKCYDINEGYATLISNIEELDKTVWITVG